MSGDNNDDIYMYKKTFVDSYEMERLTFLLRLRSRLVYTWKDGEN